MVLEAVATDGEGAPDPEISSTEWVGKNFTALPEGGRRGGSPGRRAFATRLELQPITTAGPIAVTLSAGVAAADLSDELPSRTASGGRPRLYRADAGRNQIRRESSQRRASSTLNGLLGVPPAILRPSVTLVYPMATNDSAAMAER